jgi:hypothetical protein
MIKKYKLGPSVIVHTCNHSYSGSEDLDNCSSRLASAKGYKDPISASKPGIVAYAYKPSYKEDTAKGNMVPGQP